MLAVFWEIPPCMHLIKKDQKLNYNKGININLMFINSGIFFKNGLFYVEPRISRRKNGKRAGLDYSYYFITFGHSAFRPLKDIFLE